MYGVFWITPPQQPASDGGDAPRSAGCRACGTRRPPRWRALGVVDAADDGGQRERHRERQIRQRGVARRRATRASATGWPAPSAAPAAPRQRPRPPTERQRAPEDRRAGQHRGERAGDAQRHPHAAEEDQQQHDEGDQADERIARGPSASAGTRSASIATPAIEPSSAARGTTRRTQSPAKDSTDLDEPDGDRHAPCRPSRPAPGRRWPASRGRARRRPWRRASGVSMPKGIAVTSVRPVRRMRRTAMHV